MFDLNARRERRNTLLLTFLALLLAYVLWNVPAFDFLMYPLRLFTTYVHEAGHALAALISGGQVIGFQVAPNGSGLAVTAGGSRLLILPAGYLGAALFGAGLFYLANRLPRWADGLAIGLGLGMAIFTLLFARPDGSSGAPIALGVGLGFAALLVVVGAKAPRWLTLLVLNVLAVLTSLNAVFDIWYIVHNSEAGSGMIRNDAAAFSQEVTKGLLPAWLIALSWAAIALGLLAPLVLAQRVEAPAPDARRRLGWRRASARYLHARFGAGAVAHLVEGGGREDLFPGAGDGEFKAVGPFAVNA